jgi:predicted amidohydrolase YtcJ
VKDSIYINGDIVTIDDGRPEAEAVVVRKGRIVFAGTNDEALKYRKSGSRVIDLEGKTMLPGFIDPHSHFLMVSMMSDFLSLSSPPIDSIESIEDIILRMKNHIRDKKLKPGSPVVGWGFDESLLKEGRKLTKKDLDRVSTEHLVFAVHQSGHIGVANTAILEKFNITSETENPEGGVIGRMPGSREPDGILEEKAEMSILMKLFPKPTPGSFGRSFRKGVRKYAQYGITTVQDGGTNKITIALAKTAAAFRLLKLDVVGYYMIQTPKDLEKLDKIKKMNRYRNGFRMGGAKFLLDGSPQAKTAWLSKPYHIPPEGRDADYCGYPMQEDEKFVYRVYEECLKRDMQILTHTNGDQASQQLLDNFEKAKKATGSTADTRPVMIHAQTVREDQLDRMKALNMIPSFFQAHTFFWGDWHINSVLGKERAYRISPVRSAINRGITYTLHQDTPVVPPNMPFTLWTAVNRKTRTGEVIGPDQRVTVMEALKGITINAAYQYFEEDSKGSITPGKRADLVILDKNPLKIDPDELKDLKVLETIKDGRTVYSA